MVRLFLKKNGVIIVTIIFLGYLVVNGYVYEKGSLYESQKHRSLTKKISCIKMHKMSKKCNVYKIFR